MTIIHATYPVVKIPVTVMAQVYHVFPATDYSKIADSQNKYQISSYPHYVLIDAAGKIVGNFAPRPSNNAAAGIRELLDRSGK